MLRTYDVAQADAIEAMVTEVLETGRPRRDVLVTVRSRREPFAQVVASVSWFRLTGEGGRPLGVAGTIVDVTDRYRAHVRLALLDRAAARIGSALDLFRTAQELADVTVPELADTVRVHLLDLVLRGEAPEPGPLIENLPLRRVGRCVDESAESLVRLVGDANAVPAGTPYRWSMADLRPPADRAAGCGCRMALRRPGQGEAVLGVRHLSATFGRLSD
ncbi:PAS domain-containing protein [Streptomyces sp. NPDC054919]